jgi:hypothetical protein
LVLFGGAPAVASADQLSWRGPFFVDRAGVHGQVRSEVVAAHALAGTVGRLIAAASLSAALSKRASPRGTITFKVFGPRSSAPAVCASGGTTVGTAGVSGDRTYHPSSGFKPSAPGDYRWFATPSGDQGNNPASSACGAPIPKTVVHAR